MAEKAKVYESPEQPGKPAAGSPDRVKVYEQKKAGMPVWMWLLPLLLLLGIGAWLLSRDRNPEVAASSQSLGYVNFDTDQATLTSESQATLDHAADLMKQKSDMRLRIQGYTDAAGDAAHNIALSKQRSEAVNQYLASKGIDRSRLSSEGFGESSPVTTNSTSTGKAENRRVELFQQ